MRTHKILLLVYILFLIGCSPDASDSPSPEDVFVKFIGEPGIFLGVDMIYNETLEEYFILGTDESSASNTNYFYAVTDKGGNQLYFRNVDFSSPSPADTTRNDTPIRVKRLSTGNPDYNDKYLVVGTSTNTQSNDYSKIIWKVVNHGLDNADILNDDGSVYFEINNGGIDDFGNVIGHDLVAADIIQVEGEDNVIILGTTSVPEDGDNFTTSAESKKQFFITKRSLSDNTEIWTKTLGAGEDDIALSIYELSDGDLALFGSTEKSEGIYTGTNVLAIYTNSLGTSDAGSITVGFDSDPSLDDVPAAVIKIGSEFKVVGSSSSNGNNPDAFLLNITSQGTLASAPTESLIFESTANDFELNTQATTIVRAFNGDYLLMGSYPLFQNSETGQSRLEEIMILRTNANGTKIMGKDQYYGIEAGNDRANKAIALPDGTIAVLGTFDFGSGTTLIGLMKVNIDGELRN
jgi:hypothetical protein